MTVSPTVSDFREGQTISITCTVDVGHSPQFQPIAILFYVSIYLLINRDCIVIGIYPMIWIEHIKLPGHVGRWKDTVQL